MFDIRAQVSCPGPGRLLGSCLCWRRRSCQTSTPPVRSGSPGLLCAKNPSAKRSTHGCCLILKNNTERTQLEAPEGIKNLRRLMYEWREVPMQTFI